MTRLRDWLREVPPERELLVSPSGRTHAGEMLERLQAREEVALRCRGRGVALAAPGSVETVGDLFLLDGTAATLLLTPPQLSAAERERFAAACGIEFESNGTQLRALSGPELPGPGSATRWVIPTSGTTGTPKLIAHTLESLARTTRRDARAGVPHRWGLLYDVRRFAGLQVFLQALAGRDTLIVPEGIASVDEVVRFLAEARCDALSATPTLWRRILMSSGCRALPLRRITLGGEIADQRVLDALAAAFPGAAIRHIYASTEAGVGFSVADGREGFPAAFLASAPGGVGVRIRDDGRLLLRTGSVAVALGAGLPVDPEGFLDTGDQVVLSGGRCRFVGRSSGSINVGGNKVHPEEVEGVLREHPGVAEVVVYGKRSAITGEIVCADVVATPGSDAAQLRTALARHCRERLESFKVPGIVRLVPALEAASTGKLRREASA